MLDTHCGLSPQINTPATINVRSDFAQSFKKDLNPSVLVRSCGGDGAALGQAVRPGTTNFRNLALYTGGTSIPDIKNIIKAALEEPLYDWRTVDGLVRDTSFSRDVILRHIRELDDEGVLLRSSLPDPSGQILITTKAHYSKSHNLIDRILSALSDKVR